MESSRIRVRTWFLKFSESKPRLVPETPSGIQIHAWKPKLEEYLDAYKSVGAKWGWAARLLMDRLELEALLESQSTHLWAASIENRVLGFVEIDTHVKASTEICYIGVLPAMLGKGLGTDLLRMAVKYAFQYNPGVVWLHTCALDHPAALGFYQREGFTITESRINEEDYLEEFVKSLGLKAGALIEEGFEHPEIIDESS